MPFTSCFESVGRSPFQASSHAFISLNQALQRAVNLLFVVQNARRAVGVNRQ
jgi:hypothetical protein